MIYQYPVRKLNAGSSLGNLFTFVQLDAESNIHGLWSSVDNTFHLGRMTSVMKTGSIPLVPAETTFSEIEQSTHFEGGGVLAEKKVWLPYSDDPESDPADLQRVFVDFEARNNSNVKKSLSILVEFVFPAQDSPLFSKKPPHDETVKKFRIEHRANAITVQTAGGAESLMVLVPEECAVAVQDETSAVVTLDCTIMPGETWKASLGIATGTAAKAGTQTDNSLRTSAALKEPSKTSLLKILRRSEFLTPSGVINRGIYWAKVNSLRVQHKYRSGFAFTNDPPQDIVVVRDLAWYSMGCDYLYPEFTRLMIDLAERTCFHPDGKLTEYIHADKGKPKLNDYDLNINDDTPLFVLALEHHASVHGDSAFRNLAARLAGRAADYIITQIKDGLVFCDAKGVYVWGIASWRNIINDYNLTGCVTEINAECCAALRSASRLMKMVGRTDMSQKYSAAAAELETNILARLRPGDDNLFYLNIDQHGLPHDDVTGDLVFPALLGIGGEKVRRGVVARLFHDDFWTNFGARTVARTDKSYNPESGMNLMGGIWPNLTTWFAMAGREFYPEKVAEAMERIYRISEVDTPAEFGNVVPGEFPERLHGDNFKSMGMGMSPWMPPTYLWMGVEGLLGLGISDDRVTVRPALPADWNFLAVLNVPVHGRNLDFIYFDGTLYASEKVESDLPVRVGVFRHLEDSSGVKVFEFADGLGRKIFAFSSEGFTGNLEVPVNAHLKGVSVELRQNEMKEIRVDDEN